ncbi:hypothetical protein K502DRAFT_323127 [Neoconidiobolus thromboides FSU 785]|nr:hypothetical protein K502DRAFT_323127 [Neoconidiobolus thromboides FSU 785]
MKKAKPLTCKEKRESGIYEIPEEAKKYEYFVPLNKLWQQYVDELVCNEGKEKIKNQLLKMDYHGSILKGKSEPIYWK